MTKTQVDEAITSVFTGLSSSGNEDLKNAVSEVAKDAVTVTAAPNGFIAVTPSTSGNVTTYSLSVKTKAVGDADAGLVTNAQVKDWTDSLTNGAAVSAANTKLVDGNLVFEAVTTLKNGAETLAIDREAWRTQLADNGGTDNGFMRKDAINASISDAITGAGATQDAVKSLAREAVKVQADGNLITVNGDSVSGIYSVGVKLANTESNADGLMTWTQTKNETRVSSNGSIIQAGNSAAENLQALDAGIQGVQNALNSKIGRSEISVTSGNHTSGSITTEADGSLKVKVDVADDGTVAENNTGLVTGGAVWNYVKDFTTGTGFAARDASNIEADKWISALGTPETATAVSEFNTGFITGKEVAAEVRLDTSDTNSVHYVSTGATVAQNLKKLDSP